MKYYTLDNIMELKPCHIRDKLEEYMEGRKRISLSGILSSKAYDKDKIWLVVRLIPTDKAIEFARWCADSASHIDNRYAARSADAAAWAADKAADAAYAAGAGAAAHAACVARAADAAYDAVAAAWVDASDAAWVTAFDAARQQQIIQLRLVIKENNL